MVAERYARTDTSVVGQMLRIVATNPDAIFVGASGTPAALPQIALREHGYKGAVYHTYGVVIPEFIKIGGKAVEGAIAPTGLVSVANFFTRFESHEKRRSRIDPPV